MSKHRTIRADHRRSPTAASRANKGTSAFAQDVELECIPYVIKDTVRRETKQPPTSSETAHWLSSTLKTYQNFGWHYYVPSEDHIKYLKTSDCHRNASVHFQKYFSTISMQLGWRCSGKDLRGAWRHAPEDLKAIWNGIFQANTRKKPAKASGGKRQRSQIPKPTGPYANCEPIQARTPDVGLYNSPDYSGSWNSPPTYFGSPPPDRDVIDAEWHNFYEGYPLVPRAGAEAPCYVLPPLSQEWTGPISSGAYLPSGHSSPASATCSTYGGASYFTEIPSGSGSSYLPPGQHSGGPRTPVIATQTNDHAGSWDPLNHRTQPYPSPPSRDFISNPFVPASSPPHRTPELDHLHHGNPDVSQTDFGMAFEQRSLFNFLEDYTEGCVQASSSIKDFLASLNGAMELDSTFHAGGMEPVLDLAAPIPEQPWPAYEASSGYLPETGAALGYHLQSNPRYQQSEF